MTPPPLSDAAGLAAVSWPRFLRAPDPTLLSDLYEPALQRAVHYDRCCAYFSSQVLAAAARGFGGLIQTLLDADDAAPRPAIRLLVNEQLDADDLEALLTRGDQTALIARLLRQFKTPADALSRNRLGMLAWLAASGWLEVRVGLMRHTGGMLHAKFGLVTDHVGQTLVFAGSGNETGAALVENYEELQVVGSWQDADFAAYYRARFDSLWAGTDEHVCTVPLPDAVHARLITLAPAKPPAELLNSRAALSTAMLWRFLAEAPFLPNGAAAADATALVSLWPHQRRVVEDTASAFPSGRLLCDEVGMGKTIEAILVLRRLLAGRGVKRALLLTPAGLLKQWQDELREKGGLLVPRLDKGYLIHPDDRKEAVDEVETLARHDLLLVSREWARLETNRARVLAAPPYDLVLLDEAHAARRATAMEREFNSANLLFELVRELQLRRRTRGILLLSATPMQTQPWEPWDLLSVLGVGGDWLVEFADIRNYYDGIHELSTGSLTPATATSIARLVSADPHFPSAPTGLSTADATSLRDGLLFAAADRRRMYTDWLRHGSPLGRTMHRNTRETLRQYHKQGLLALPPPRRDVRDVIFDYTAAAERDFYNAVGNYIDQRFAELEKEKTGKGFVMTIYRRRAASSPLAIRRSLLHRQDLLNAKLSERAAAFEISAAEELDSRDLGDVDLDEHVDPGIPKDANVAQRELHDIDLLLQRLDGLGMTDSKLNRFWEVLQKLTADGRSVLVFTEYTDTMAYLRDHLQPVYGATLGCYSGAGGEIWQDGAWQPVSKGEIMQRLRQGQLRILLCTDAASEGLNLQAASTLVNYDLPWNPSKVEQRIGRIDRIGQEQPLLPIRNLFLVESVDMRVYQALRQRCGLFEHFVGRMQPVLAIARDALRRNVSGSGLEQTLKELEQAAAQIGQDEATASAYQESNATTTKESMPPATRADLELALDALAQGQPKIKAARVQGSARWRVTGLGRKLEVTTDRSVLERDKHVLPLTLGAPLLQEIIEHLPAVAGRAPLVLATHAVGPFRCTEALWIGPDGDILITSASQLRQLLATWHGAPVSAARVVEAETQARAAARQRVEQMAENARAREQASLDAQVQAARERLLRELARTLRCAGSGDLNRLFQEQLNREARPDGRYRRALKLLGSFPTWSEQHRRAASQCADQLSNAARQARLNLGSELEAAINDPRWRVVG